MFLKMEEIWREVPGTNGKYEVSSLGRIKGPGQIRKAYKILKPFPVGWHRDYLAVHISNRTSTVHGLVCVSFHGPKPSRKHEPNHKDGNKHNNKRENLEWVTRSENRKHADRTGLRVPPSGERHYNFGRKLSEQTKQKMRETELKRRGVK